jgi:predicted TIM-barrel fold metal-dependent hydrolase
LAISIPIRVEDRRQQSWLADIPDVAHDEVAALVNAVPSGRFLIHNGSGFPGSALGKRDNRLPRNYVIDLALLTVELANEAGQLLANLGEDRVVFGTGMPFHYPDPALVKLDLLDVPAAVKEKIRQGTAAALLRLP